MNDCQNINQLSDHILDIIAWVFRNHIVGWDLCHAVEIRLDNPLHNLLQGEEGIHFHAGSASRNYIKNYHDAEWAVIHKQDPTWLALPLADMERRGAEIVARDKEVSE